MMHQRVFNDVSKSVKRLGGACKTHVWRGMQDTRMEGCAMSVQRGRVRGIKSHPKTTREA